MVKQTRYDTADIRKQDRFAFWQEAVCNSYVQLGCDASNRTDFNGSIDVSHYSVLSISRVQGKAHSVQRRHRDIRKATDAYFLLSLQIDNTSRISQFGETAELSSGDMAIYSSTDPYALQLSDGFSQVVVQLPKERLLARLPNAESMAAKKIDGNSGLGQLVRDSILNLSHYADSSSETLQSLVQETLIDLIATGLASQQDDSPALSCPEQHVMLRVKTHLRNHIGDPSLDRQKLANEIGMSVRRLNAIFAKEGTSISAYIRQSRFNGVAQELKDARFATLSISEIACKYGFVNFQHFSKSFRTHFGMSPREYRAKD